MAFEPHGSNYMKRNGQTNSENGPIRYPIRPKVYYVEKNEIYKCRNILYFKLV